jgi:hypothetical protein
MEWFNFYKAGKDVAFSESAGILLTTSAYNLPCYFSGAGCKDRHLRANAVFCRFPCPHSHILYSLRAIFIYHGEMAEQEINH